MVGHGLSLGAMALLLGLTVVLPAAGAQRPLLRTPLRLHGPVTATSWSWETVASPAVVGVNHDVRASLSVVSCSSGKYCVAVGSKGNGTITSPLLEAYDGRSWRVLPLRQPPGAFLYGVSCSPSSYCMSVGQWYTSSSRYGALVDVHTTRGWLQIPGPPTAARLQAVSCVATATCIALGDAKGAPEAMSAYEYADGRWSTMPFLGGSPGPDDGFNSVSCTSVTFCMAVGYAGTGTYISARRFAELFDGRYWVAASEPGWTGTGVSALGAVSCGEADGCLATGSLQSGPYRGAGRTLALPVVESFLDARWTGAAVPVPLDSTSADLGGVSCAGTTCVVVGATGDVGVVSTFVAGRWTGASLTFALGGQGFLGSLSCPTASFCAGVGSVADRPLLVLGRPRGVG